MSFDSIFSKLLSQFFYIPTTLFVVFRFRIFCFHIRNVAQSPVRILTISEVVESNYLFFEKLLRRGTIIFLRGSRIKHQCIYDLIGL